MKRMFTPVRSYAPGAQHTPDREARAWFRPMRTLASPVRAGVNVRLDILDARTERVLNVIYAKNRAVDAGLNNLIRDLMYGDTLPVLSHCGVGSGSTATTAADTALEAELLRGTFVQKLKGSKTLTIRWVVSSQQLNGSTLREWGLFTAGVGGTMYARVVATPIVKTIAISVLATWTLSWEADL